MTVLAIQLADVGAAVLLLAFVAWGAWHGAFRQLLSLVVLGGALFLAAALAPRLEDTASKVADLDAEERCLAAWAALLVGGMVAGGILLRLLGKAPDRLRLPGTADRIVAGILGLAKGAAVLTLVAYALLIWRMQGLRPSWAGEVEGSQTARVIREVRLAVGPVVGLPPCVQKWAEDVDARLAVP